MMFRHPDGYFLFSGYISEIYFPLVLLISNRRIRKTTVSDGFLRALSAKNVLILWEPSRITDLNLKI